jgi:hypothetical protein
LKQALDAVAKLANVNLDQAVQTVRHNPILGEEIHIEEELINLEESLASHRVADHSLRNYPKLYHHVVREQRLMLKHCCGQLVRMLQGRRLPRRYSEKDTQYALSKLIQILITEALRAGKHIDNETLSTVKPFLTLRQRKELGEWGSLNPRMYLQLMRHKFTSIWQTS